MLVCSIVLRETCDDECLVYFVLSLRVSFIFSWLYKVLKIIQLSLFGCTVVQEERKIKEKIRKIFATVILVAIVMIISYNTDKGWISKIYSKPILGFFSAK